MYVTVSSCKSIDSNTKAIPIEVMDLVTFSIDVLLIKVYLYRVQTIQLLLLELMEPTLLSILFPIPKWAVNKHS